MFTTPDRIRRRWQRSADTAHVLFPLRRFLPMTRIRDAVMTRRGLKWGVPVMLLAALYYEAVKYLARIIEQAGPEWSWLHLVVILCVYNTIKMFLIGPISLIKLVRVRHQERTARRRQQAAASEPERETAARQTASPPENTANQRTQRLTRV